MCASCASPEAQTGTSCEMRRSRPAPVGRASSVFSDRLGRGTCASSLHQFGPCQRLGRGKVGADRARVRRVRDPVAIPALRDASYGPAVSDRPRAALIVQKSMPAARAQRSSGPGRPMTGSVLIRTSYWFAPVAAFPGGVDRVKRIWFAMIAGMFAGSVVFFAQGASCHAVRASRP